MVFVCNDTWKTYLYRAEKIEGPWRKNEIEGFYHDCSLLFDDDDRTYVVYGNRQIYLTELNEDLTGPKEGGLNRLILEDAKETPLGYEGSHLYKINGRYYLFFIHSLKERWRRVEACFSSDSLEGEFIGGDIFNDDMGFRDSGVAQGGIVCGVDGKWNAILFQDSGAVGRIPILVPVTWKDDMPVYGDNGKVPETFAIEDLKPDHVYDELVGSDDFKDADVPEQKRRYDSFGFKSCWQFSHEPELSLVKRDGAAGNVSVTTDKVCVNLVQAKNVLTQRTIYPACAAEVTVDGSLLKEGDYAGLCLLESSYALTAITRRNGELYVVMLRRVIENGSFWGERKDSEPGEELACVKLSGESVRLRAEAVFENKTDMARLFYYDGTEKKQIGPECKLVYKLDHFTGARFGLFVFGTKEIGGSAAFSAFTYEK